MRPRLNHILTKGLLGASSARPPRRLQFTLAAEEPRPLEMVPGPTRWPVLGSLPALAMHPATTKNRLYLLTDSLFREYGDIFRIHLPCQPPLVFICHPDDIEQVHRTNFDLPHRDFFESYGLARSHNKFFRKGQTGVFSEWASLRDAHDELPDDYLHQVFRWALETLGLVTFNKRLGCLDNTPDALRMIKVSDDLISGLHELEMGSFVRFWRWVDTPALRKVKRAQDEMLRFVQASVLESQRSLQSRNPESKEELNIVENLLLDPVLTYEDVHAFLIDVFFAGIDTTSLSLTYTMMRLAQNQDKQKKLQEELDNVLRNGVEVLSTHHIKELRYLKACVKEALRMDPPLICVVRKTTRDMVLRGYMVPKGTNMQIYSRGSSMNEEFFPKATQFLPERWLRDSSSNAIHPYASLPFGAGVRNCVGRRFAEQEIHILLARLFHKYRLEWHYEPLNPVLNMLMLPDKPLRFTMKERR
ncbi:probable cytochrome P450 49a1 [Penaeus japonicus]|uniref:probable cytochrome P450 49a1 n=1 Tax=Penaeus japonicus TaxID=27405 RepID=UPI001C716E7A|nr:probable cytochrome P450 49a1 [Penaeus japonicus]